MSDSERRCVRSSESISDWKRRFLIGWTRGFFLAYGIKTVLGFLSVFSSFVFLKSSRRRGRSVWLRLMRVGIDEDSVRLGLCLGFGSGLFRVAYPILRNTSNFFGRYAAFFSGCIGGLSMLADPGAGGDRRNQLALNVAVRALESRCRRSYRRGSLRGIRWRGSSSLWTRLPTAFVSTYFAEALFQLSCFEIMLSWFYHRERLPAFYVRWITKMSEMPPSVLRVLKDYYFGNAVYGVRYDGLKTYCESHGLDPTRANLLEWLPKNVVHPHDPDSCTSNAFRRFRNAFLRACSMYTPVHALPVLIWKRDRVLRDPTTEIGRVVVSIGRSSFFLGAFVAIVHASICFWRNRFRFDESSGVVLGCFLCGTSVFFERKTRRLDLALYVVPMALQSFWRRLRQRGVVPFEVPFFDVILYAVSLGTIAQTMETDADCVRPSLRTLFGWLFGCGGRDVRSRCLSKEKSIGEEEEAKTPVNLSTITRIGPTRRGAVVVG